MMDIIEARVGRRRKRRVWSDAEKRMICVQARLPGISVSQVARRYDVNANLVFSWLKDARFAPDEVAVEEHAGFLPVEIIDAGAAPDREAEVDAPVPEGCIDMELAGGHRLRITGAYDPEALARLIRGLSAS